MNHKKYHFIAIGGIGMSAIAHILLKKGFLVSGSDVQKSYITEGLENLGAECFLGHAASNLKDVDAVVVSSAVAEDNVELLEAKRLGLPIFHRAEMLGAFLTDKKGIAIAGAHGKTTTTAMAALVLEYAKLDPTVLIGGVLDVFKGNAKYGRGEYVVVEADESDGSFLRLEPQFAIITNIENDHMDHYGSIEKMKEAFEEFLVALKSRNGIAVINADDEDVMNAAVNSNVKKIMYSIDGKADYEARDIDLQGLGSKFTVYKQGNVLAKFHLVVPGKHNISNALAVIALSDLLDIDLLQIQRGLSDFHGTKRRFQIKGKINNINIVDDYAHHPTEVKATLAATKAAVHKRIIAVFQPHRYTRTQCLQKEFATAFADADIIIFTDIYAASEKPIEGINGKTLPEAVFSLTGKKPIYIADKGKIAKYISEIVEPGDMVLTLGAGNVYTVGEELLDMLLKKYA